ncbi:helix-turn-helix domain-containing protein [Lacticaseibacillus suihuaensis]
MTLGANLQAARVAANMSQETVAQALYITRQTVSRWEQGHTLPNIYALSDLCQLYGCSLDALVGPSAAKKEEVNMHKINWMALFGLIWFDIIVALAVVSVIGSLILTAWAIEVSFVVSPLLVIGANLLGYAVPWHQLAFAAVLAGVGIALYQPVLRLTLYVWQMLRHYLRYSRQAVFSR